MYYKYIKQSKILLCLLTVIPDPNVCKTKQICLYKELFSILDMHLVDVILFKQ